MKSRETKRVEANERNEYWRSLSVQEKLDRLDTRPGASAKQRKQLAKD